jgi:hypothetical protein
MSAVLQDAVQVFTGRCTAHGNGLRHRFAVLPSRRQPRCLVPLGDPRATLEGFQIYTPYDFRARLHKQLLARMVTNTWSAWAVHSLYIGEPLGIKALVANVTGERNPAFALLLSSPAEHRKLTIQVMRSGGETLGYLKLGLTPPASERVRHEAAVLEALAGLRPQVPRVLYAGEWQENYLVFQSCLEGRPGPAKLSGMHVEFLEKLAAIGRVNKPGHQVVEEAGARWAEVAWRCDWRWQRLGAAALAEARRQLAAVTVPCSLAHGDFAPWNTRAQDGRLSVFDWESCRTGVPIGWDTFHFSMQVAALRKKTWREQFDLDAAPGARGLFLLYLLDTLGQALAEPADSPGGLEYGRQVLVDELARGRL